MYFKLPSSFLNVNGEIILGYEFEIKLGKYAVSTNFKSSASFNLRALYLSSQGIIYLKLAGIKEGNYIPLCTKH